MQSIKNGCVRLGDGSLLKPADPPKFGDCGDPMLCPRCGHNCLHHGKIEIFDRSEDAEQTRVISFDHVEFSSKMLKSNMVENPSARRHGLTIAVSCEQCGPGLRLEIAQHKGFTLIQWRYVDEVHYATF